MKPLTQCPHCSSCMVKKTIPDHLNPLVYKNCEQRCCVDFFQYYKKSYDEDSLSYVSFYTPNKIYSVVSYFEYSFYHNATHVYLMAELTSKGRAMPALRLPKAIDDFSDLTALENKLSGLINMI